MAKPLNFFIAAVIACCALQAMNLSAAESEYQSCARIKKLIAEKQKTAEAEINRFSDRYPRSGRTGELMFLFAESADTAAESLRRHRLCALQRFYPHSEISRLAVCRILFLQSSWKELKAESASGIKTGGAKTNDFVRYHTLASIESGDIDSAENDISRLLAEEMDFNSRAITILIRSHLEKIRSGFSRQYIYSLRESAVDYRDSDYFQTALYFLGEFHDNNGDIDRAYSAYSDLVKFYPESPEAEYAAEKLNELKKNNPSRMGYIPSAKRPASNREIDIRHDSPAEEVQGDEYYSVTIGPLPSAADMKEISRMLKGTTVRKVKSKGGYSLVAGKFDSKESAYRLKIRIAEEYGINGRIVHITEKEGKIFVYGE